MAGIYIHIPFCKQACYYCDFHFSTNQLSREKTIQAIGLELLLQKDYLGGEEIQTIYFGGGTPSILSGKELDHLLEVIYSNFPINPNPEVTLEANPDDLTTEKLRALRRAGINRLSIGIQSFDDEVLKYLNRAHDSVMASRCFHRAQEAGFDNMSIDLIYAIPALDNVRWKEAIDEALRLNPQHISSYALTIEEKTVYGKWAARGKIKAVDDDAAAHQLQILVDVLETHGYEQYEVSNFSKAGFQSQHNSNYWKNKNYLGVGPSAHSYNGSSRQYNISNNHLYVDSIRSMKIPSSVEVLSREDRINEYLLTSLRTAWGVNLTVLRQDFGYDLLNTQEQYFQTLVDSKLAFVKNDTLILSKSGLLLADKIASDLFVIAP
jgi:oxygen-independent coproporphyrinogen III oxidase